MDSPRLPRTGCAHEASPGPLETSRHDRSELSAGPICQSHGYHFTKPEDTTIVYCNEPKAADKVASEIADAMTEELEDQDLLAAESICPPVLLQSSPDLSASGEPADSLEHRALQVSHRPCASMDGGDILKGTDR